MPDAPAGPVTAVFVHVHYPEIWREMSAVLAERMEIPFRLVLTSATPGAVLAIPDTPHLLGVEQVAVENRGRDIRPFLVAVQRAQPFDIGLKLHTKKSPQRLDGAHWRAALLDSLLPVTGAAAIMTRLYDDSRIGLVAPAEFCLSVAPWVLQNEPGMVRIAAAAGSELCETDLEDAYFAAGSMFWFRAAAIEALASDPVLTLFEPETGQLDGTIAHAMERMFPVEAKRRGLVSLAMPALMASRQGDTHEALASLARQYADIPTRYFPGPNILEEALPDPAGPLTRLGRLRARLRPGLGRVRRKRRDGSIWRPIAGS